MTLVEWGGLVALAVALTVAGGAVSGVMLAGRDLGSVLALLMGALFGPLAALPAVGIGLLVLELLHRGAP